MSNSRLPMVLSVAALLLAGGAYWHIKPITVAAPQKETAYERVLRTGTLRCGYDVYEPSIIMDPNTKKLSGIFYDLMNEVGKRLNVKVDWSTQVGYGVIPQELALNRIDAFCGVLWPTAERARAGTFSVPVYYSAVYVFARANDKRFDADYTKLNNAAYTVSIKDGDVAGSIAAADFPQAKHISIGEMAHTSQMLEDVATKKADATFNELVGFYNYSKANPGKLKVVGLDKPPLRYFASTVMMGPNETQLKTMIDVAIGELIQSGFVDKLLQKYEGDRNLYMRVAKPYNQP
jgi:ABC-type amino acid transport substrate-binding protein